MPLSSPAIKGFLLQNGAFKNLTSAVKEGMDKIGYVPLFFDPEIEKKKFEATVSRVLDVVAGKIESGQMSFTDLQNRLNKAANSTGSARNEQLRYIGMDDGDIAKLDKLIDNSGIDPIAAFNGSDFTYAQSIKDRADSRDAALLVANASPAEIKKPIAIVAPKKTVATSTKTKATPATPTKEEQKTTVETTITTVETADGSKSVTAEDKELEQAIASATAATAENKKEVEAIEAKIAEGGGGIDLGKLLGDMMQFLFGKNKGMGGFNMTLLPKAAGSIAGFFGIETDPERIRAKGAYEINDKMNEYYAEKRQNLSVPDQNVLDQALAIGRDQATLDYEQGISNEQILENFKKNLDSQLGHRANADNISMHGISSDGKTLNANDIQQSAVIGDNSASALSRNNG